MAEDQDTVLAVDVGGTRLKGVLVDTAVHVLDERVRPTPHGDAEVVLNEIAIFVKEIAAHAARPRAVGIVVPGIIDEASGIGILAANLGWRDVALRALLESRLDMPLAIGQDVRAGGLAEVRLGAALGSDNALFVAIGTGVGAAVIIDGRPVVGGGFAGEIGHMPIAEAGDECGCGQHGCLETVASAAAITRRYNTRTGRGLGADEIAEAAHRANDPVATEVWNDAIEALAGALATCVAVLGTEVIVVGGGLAESSDALLDPLRAALDRRLAWQRRPRVVRAALGDRAGAFGAALLAWQHPSEPS